MVTTRKSYVGDLNRCILHLTQDWSGGENFCSRTQINAGVPRPLFESLPGPLLKSGLWPLDRSGTHQETISRRLKQLHTSSDTRLEWSGGGGRGALFESDSDKCWRAEMQALFESTLGHY